MISIAIVSSIAILLLDTYRGRDIRYRPTLLYRPFNSNFRSIFNRFGDIAGFKRKDPNV